MGEEDVSKKGRGRSRKGGQKSESWSSISFSIVQSAARRQPPIPWKLPLARKWSRSRHHRINFLLSNIFLLCPFVLHTSPAPTAKHCQLVYASRLWRMSDIGELSQEQKDFLEPFLPHDACDNSEHETRTLNSQPPHTPPEQPDLPFVTLTYATSLDSMIALAPGVRTSLSGPQSKAMTHYLRLRHDAILVGASTAIIDDPSLNCRYPGATFEDQPQPIVVDTKGRYRGRDDMERKAFRLAHEGAGKRPWIVSSTKSQSGARMSQLRGDHLLIYQDGIPHRAGQQSAEQQAPLPWLDILAGLKIRGVNSVMIEGGATVISTLLSLPNLVSSVIITIAPTFLGQGGVAVAPAPRFSTDGQENAAWLQDTRWQQFGSDGVLCGKLAAKP